MYLWSRSTKISRFAIVTMLSIPPWGAVSSRTTPVTPFALANKVSYDWVTVDLGELIKNGATPHQFSPLDFTTSSAAKSLGNFHHSAKVILSHRQADVIKMIMINSLWDSSRKLFSAFHKDYGWKLKVRAKFHVFGRSGRWHFQKAPKVQQHFYRSICRVQASRYLVLQSNI